MKMIVWWARVFIVAATVGTGVVFPTHATTLTFDDIPEDQDVPAGYGGLIWKDLSTVNACDRPAVIANSGLCFGRISVANVIFSLSTLTSIKSQSGTFNLNSFYLTASSRDGLEVTITGGGPTGAVPTVTLTASVSPTFYTLNWSDLNALYFNIDWTSGTKNSSVAFDVASFAIDNLTINETSDVSEPWGMTCFIIGLLGLGFLRRKHELICKSAG